MNTPNPGSGDCRVAVFDEPNAPLSIQHQPIPSLDAGELLVRVSACTVCGSDLHTITGNRKEKTPTILGHEITGQVVSIGSENCLDYTGDEISIGDRITWSICISCGQCDRCNSGIPQKCIEIRKIGHEVFETSSVFLGGFAEYIVLPESTSVFRITSDIPDEVICPANCATATVIAASRKLQEISDKSVLLIGAGMLGLTATAYFKTQGAKHITVVEPGANRRDLALRFGADEVVEQISSLERDYNAILDFSGSSAAIEESISRLMIGGTIVLVGTVSPSPFVSVDPEFVVRNLVSVFGVHNYHPADLESAIEFLVSHGEEFPFAELVEKAFALEDINTGIQYALHEKPIRVMIKP